MDTVHERYSSSKGGMLAALDKSSSYGVKGSLRYLVLHITKSSRHVVDAVYATIEKAHAEGASLVRVCSGEWQTSAVWTVYVRLTTNGSGGFRAVGLPCVALPVACNWQRCDRTKYWMRLRLPRNDDPSSAR